MSEPTTLVWLRRDLRLADNPALAAAATRGKVVPVYVWAPEEDGDWAPGGAARFWVHGSLAAMDASLDAKGARLVLRRGPSAAALIEVARACGATAVHWNALPEPHARERDAGVARALRAAGLEAVEHGGALLFEPGAIRSGEGNPFAVFTPFWRACLAGPEPAPPLPAPRQLAGPARAPASLRLEALGLDPHHPWTTGIARTWQPGEAAAGKRLRALLDHKLADYDEERDRPDHEGTSTLSPYLHHGELSARTVWQAVRPRGLGARAQHGAASFLRELGWREFAHHVLHRFPALPDRPFRDEFRRFGWQQNAAFLRAWQRGRTGYPLVDAGMRQLWTTGWMHNRVRMVVASFLIKHLLVPWQEGERWFWDTLVDADLANNAMNWQWVAGTGTDAAPFFRIFNPVLQSRKFDPQGAYIRRWVPELAAVAGDVHEPWRLARPPAGYPAPIVEHGPARSRALALFKELRA